MTLWGATRFQLQWTLWRCLIATRAGEKADSLTMPTVGVAAALWAAGSARVPWEKKRGEARASAAVPPASFVFQGIVFLLMGCVRSPRVTNQRACGFNRRSTGRAALLAAPCGAGFAQRH